MLFFGESSMTQGDTLERFSYLASHPNVCRPCPGGGGTGVTRDLRRGVGAHCQANKTALETLGRNPRLSTARWMIGSSRDNSCFPQDPRWACFSSLSSESCRGEAAQSAPRGASLSPRPRRAPRAECSAGQGREGPAALLETQNCAVLWRGGGVKAAWPS